MFMNFLEKLHGYRRPHFCKKFNQPLYSLATAFFLHTHLPLPYFKLPYINADKVSAPCLFELLSISIDYYDNSQTLFAHSFIYNILNVFLFHNKMNGRCIVSAIYLITISFFVKKCCVNCEAALF